MEINAISSMPSPSRERVWVRGEISQPYACIALKTAPSAPLIQTFSRREKALQPLRHEVEAWK